MPTLELLTQIESRPDLPNVTKYGFNTEFFKEFDDIIGALDIPENSDTDDALTIKSGLLRTGACPNESRVYHAITGTSWKLGTRDDRIENLLDEETDISRGDAGILFEKWINAANEALNEWIESLDDSVFLDRNMPSPIAKFYLSRLSEIQSICSELEIELESIKMDIQYQINAEALGEGKPDGVWPNIGYGTYPGGVFESKLAVPHEEGIECELTGYAVHYEREQGYPIEFGVVQYLDEEQNQIIVDGIHLDDANRDLVQENIQNFTNLIGRSKLEPSWEEEEPLEDRIIKPERPKYGHVCNDCPYEWTCQSDRHFSAYETVPRNLKLSGNKLHDALVAIARGEPSRRQVVHEAMQIFDDDVTEKSGFRGMVAPTTSKLNFARSMRNGQVFFLSPNGKAAIYEESPTKTIIGRCIRDKAYLDFGLYAEAIDYVDKLPAHVREQDERTYKTIRRFVNQFIDEFDVDLPKLADRFESKIFALYQSEPEINYLTNKDQRRKWIRTALPPNKQTQIEDVRWKMIRTLLVSGMAASYWFVDEAIWCEWNTPEPIIELYEGSTFRQTQLIKGNTPYDGLLVKGNAS